MTGISLKDFSNEISPANEKAARQALKEVRSKLRFSAPPILSLSHPVGFLVFVLLTKVRMVSDRL